MENEKLLIERLNYIRSLGYDWYEYSEQEMRNPITDESWVERTVVFIGSHCNNMVDIDTTEMMIPLFNEDVLQMNGEIDDAIRDIKFLNKLENKIKK